MKSVWERRIARAEELSESNPSAAQLLGFYARIAGLQKSIYDGLKVPAPGPACVAAYYPRLREIAGAIADIPRESIEPLLIAHWNHEPDPSDKARFVARALLQPFAEALADLPGSTPCSPPSRDREGAVCPFCSARPLVSVLRGEGEGGKRYLVCSLCATEWEFRRILCPECGEENKDKLPIYTAPGFDYIRVEACDSCRGYLKCIDLTRNGLAVAPADEIAGVALNVWAEEHGYTKIEPNLLGL